MRQTLTFEYDTAEELIAAVRMVAGWHTPEPLDGGPLDTGTLEWVLEVLRTANPSEVEALALDAVPPGAGAASTTAAVIALCVELLQQEAGRAR